MLKSNQKDLLCFSRLQMVVLKDSILFLKQESGSSAQGSRMKKAFSKVLHARSKVKEFFNFFQIQEIYLIWQNLFEIVFLLP